MRCIITGGAGNWDNTNGNWTIDAGVNNIAWNNDVAIFSGTAGTVTLSEPISAVGITFNSGTTYALFGDVLTLTGATPTVTAAAGVTGTISSVIAGANSVSHLMERRHVPRG